MPTLYKVQNYWSLWNVMILQYMKRCNFLVMCHFHIYIYITRWKLRLSRHSTCTIIAHTELSPLYSFHTMSFLFQQLSISIYHLSVNQMKPNQLWSRWHKVCIQRDQRQHGLFTFDLWTSPSSVSPTPRSFLVFSRLCRSPLLCFL